MTVLKYEKLEQYVSEPRLGKYLNACDNSKTQAKKLYSANLRICQSFYPILNLFEIFVRNSVNVALTNHFNDSNWIITEKAGFMSDSSLTQSRFYLKRCVEKAIRNNGANSSAGKIISDQTFGFWSALFLPHHYQLLQGSVIDSFPNKSANVNRGVIHNNLKKINIFRNRVYHNEPICFDGTTISFDKAKDVHASIIDVINWIDPELLAYLDGFDNITNKITQTENNFCS